ncbi:MAG: hypothetical protein ABW122_05635 [Ilumatobacteraceae bacterium]
MEPNGWAVAGLETNFYAAASAHTLSGELLDEPAEVRFTPVGYSWDYGDGTSTSTDTGGRSWAQLGLDEFASTPSSHVYERRGDYVVSLVVQFGAEYRRESGPWVPVQGVLNAAAPSISVDVVAAGTVLVDDDCGSRAAVGC